MIAKHDCHTVKGERALSSVKGKYVFVCCTCGLRYWTEQEWIKYGHYHQQDEMPQRIMF